MPPLNETRFLSNEVVMQLGMNMSRAQVEELARRNGLEIIASEAFGLLGRTVYRFRITGGGEVRGIIGALQAIGATISAQPSYQFELTEAVAPSDTNRRGDSAQYIVTKLQLPEAHAIATGKNVKVAVIDSEIDGQHPDLQGVIAATYDALPSDDKTAHPHGTGMAGAIASHQRLLGVAPGARLLAVRAFGVNTGGAQGTSMNIVKGLEWAVKEGAQVINMSFAGPRDPILEQAIRGLKDRGVILIAAAGNAGPKSPVLFPGGDPNVIAVSATDMDDKTYAQREPRQAGRDRGARRRHPGAGAGGRLPAHHRHLGRGRAYQRRGRADAGAQSAAHAGRSAQHPGGDREEAAAGTQRGRGRPGRSGAGAVQGGAEVRAAAVTDRCSCIGRILPENRYPLFRAMRCKP